MFSDDSMETEELNDYAAGAEPLKLQWELELSKIWIPATLLPNRKKSQNPNENKPFIYYSLDKPDNQNRFSVYADECPQHHESRISSTSTSRISLKLTNNDNVGLHIQETKLSQNAAEQDTTLDSITSKKNSSVYPVNSDKLDNALRDSQETYNFLKRNAYQWESKESDNCSIQEYCKKESCEDLTRRMAEILSEKETLTENWHYEDIIKTNEATYDSNLPLSANDSLEELYYSDENENQFAEEYELVNPDCESPDKTCSIYTQSCKQKQLSESFMGKSNELEQANNNDDKNFQETVEILSEKQKFTVNNLFKQTEFDEQNKLVSAVHAKDPEQKLLAVKVSSDFTGSNDSFMYNLNELENAKDNSDENIEETVEIPSGKQKILAGNVLKQTQLDELNKMESVNLPKEHKQELFDEGVSIDFIPEVLEFPVAYKRPPLQEHINKTKLQKEKKKTKKCKINIPLEDLFQDAEIDRFKVPEIDEFYENLVRQGICKPHNHITNEFPLIDPQEKQQINDHILTCTNSSEQKISIWDSSPSSLADKIKREENTESQLESKISSETIIIDRIPVTVSRENIENLILGYGELKSLIIEQHGWFQRAKIQMDFICDVDWIIDCLNDSEPFGTFSTENIKCYRQTRK